MSDGAPSRGSKPGYNALRRGRVSVAGADYFLTLTLRRPIPTSQSLAKPDLVDAIRRRCGELEQQELWCVNCAMVMPDHLHLLVRLEKADLAEVIRPAQRFDDAQAASLGTALAGELL